MTGSSDGSTIASEVGGGGGDGALVGTGSGAALRLLRSINAVQQWKGGGHLPRFQKKQQKAPTSTIYRWYMARWSGSAESRHGIVDDTSNGESYRGGGGGYGW